MSAIKISYDPEVDAVYIRLTEGECECRTLRLNEEIALNIGPGETLVGIEILDAKEVLGKGELPRVVLENLTLAPAAWAPAIAASGIPDRGFLVPLRFTRNDSGVGRKPRALAPE